MDWTRFVIYHMYVIVGSFCFGYWSHSAWFGFGVLAFAFAYLMVSYPQK